MRKPVFGVSDQDQQKQDCQPQEMAKGGILSDIRSKILFYCEALADPLKVISYIPPDMVIPILLNAPFKFYTSKTQHFAPNISLSTYNNVGFRMVFAEYTVANFDIVPSGMALYS